MTGVPNALPEMLFQPLGSASPLLACYLLRNKLSTVGRHGPLEAALVERCLSCLSDREVVKEVSEPTASASAAAH